MDFDTEFTDKIICPYCGSENDNADFDDDRDWKCFECEKTFDIDAHYSVSFTTAKNCRLNNQQHNFVYEKELPHYTDKDKKLYKYQCSLCPENELRYKKD